MPAQISTQATTILITSDCPLLTLAISGLLQPEFSIIKESNTTFLNQLDKADVVLLCCTTKLPPKVYVRLTKKLNDKQLIILTNLEEAAIPITSNMGLISLKETPEDIEAALYKIINQKTQYSQKAAHEIIRRYITPNRSTPETLTKREKEVYPLLELSDKEIAKLLNISIPTVRYHIQQITQKLGFNLRKKLRKNNAKN